MHRKYEHCRASSVHKTLTVSIIDCVVYISICLHFYFQQSYEFVENHVELGEKYIEFVKFACRKSEICTFCSTHDWVGPPCETVPKPYPDYDANGLH